MTGFAPYAGYVGLLLIVVSWQFAARRKILTANAVAFVFFAIELAYKGADVGALLMAFASMNSLLGASARFRSIKVQYQVLLTGVQLLPALLLYSSPADILPMVAHVTGTIAFFSRTTAGLRAWAPVGTVLWAMHNFIFGAWGQLIADFLILGSMTMGAWRARGVGGT